VQAVAGKEVPFSIEISSAAPLPPRATVTIDGMPAGATFSEGRPYGETGWTLRPDEISGDLRLRLPKAGQTDLRIELVAADGDIMASAFTHLNVATEPHSALVLRPEESDRINDLMVHGQKMIEVGYLAGARAYFKRAAEAGSAAAALALGDTYDRVLIDSIGAHGIKADLAQARTWYERARELGSEEAKAKLERLKKADNAQLTSVESAPSNGGIAGPTAPDTKGQASVDPAQKAGEADNQK
jgi:TPR repeat protein